MKGSVLHYHNSFYKQKKTATWKSPTRSHDYSNLTSSLVTECLVLLSKKLELLPNSTFGIMSLTLESNLINIPHSHYTFHSY